MSCIWISQDQPVITQCDKKTSLFHLTGDQWSSSTVQPVFGFWLVLDLH
jgi:hypothetical protein